MVRVAMRAELAGLLPTQKPGRLSKMPTLISPPYRAGGVEVVDDAASFSDEHDIATTALARISAIARRCF
jgi:hypothetical protein